MISDSSTQPMLQEPIITQRNGRYVIPLRAEFKGRVKSIVHDQSSSGATLFVEPLAVVELNNHWHELQLAERDEIRRILSELSARVGAEAEAICGIINALAQFDFYLMCAKYAEDLHASEPLLRPISPPQNAHHPGTVIKLFKARHPLLDPQKVVPIDLDLDPATFALVITGPNTGGKTVTLKTVGLMVLMAQCGLHIPRFRDQSSASSTTSSPISVMSNRSNNRFPRSPVTSPTSCASWVKPAQNARPAGRTRRRYRPAGGVRAGTGDPALPGGETRAVSHCHPLPRTENPGTFHTGGCQREHGV